MFIPDGVFQNNWPGAAHTGKGAISHMHCIMLKFLKSYEIYVEIGKLFYDL